MNNSSVSVVKNYIYNLAYQVVTLLIPILMIPYTSRILQPEGLGLYSFTFSITTYFSYIALLGVHLYGTKKIAISRKDSSAMEKNFWEIFLMKAIMSFISIAVFLVTIIFLEHKQIYLILGICLIANMFDITWFFTGNENFKMIFIRNIVIKILTVLCILLFVKSKNDLGIYVLIFSLGELFSQLIMWISVIKTDLTKNLPNIFRELNPFSHFKGLLALFIPQAVILLYTSLNITMLGLMSTNIEVGYFDVVNRIINTILVLVSALSSVLIPRISILIDSNRKDLVENVLEKSIQMVTYLAYPMSIGVMIISKVFVPWYLGSMFGETVLLLSLYSIKIVLVTMSNVIGMQFLIPAGRNKEFIYSVSIGALVTLLLNIFLIQNIGALGAVIGSLIGELTVTFIQVFITKRDIKFIKFVYQTRVSFISSVFMGLVVYSSIYFFSDRITSFINKYLSLNISSGINIMFLILIGGFSYITINFILRNRAQFEIVKNIKRIILNLNKKRGDTIL